MRLSHIISGVIVAAVLSTASPAAAQLCTVSSTGVSFGTYSPLSGSPTTSTGTVTVNCTATVAIGISYSIQIGAGAGGSFGARRMASGTNLFAYQLYTNAALSMIWGDGTSGTGTVSDSYGLLSLGSVTRNYTAYGRVAPMQNVAPGAYTDVLTILISY